MDDLGGTIIFGNLHITLGIILIGSYGQLITAHVGGIDGDVPPRHSLSHHTRSLRLSQFVFMAPWGETIGVSLQTIQLSLIGIQSALVEESLFPVRNRIQKGIPPFEN